MQNFNIRLILICLILAFIQPATFAAETAKPLALEDCVNLAKQNNESIKIQQQKIAQAKQRHVQAKGDILPSISFDYSMFFRDTADGLYSGEGTDSHLALSQPLFYGFRKKNTISLSRIDMQREETRHQSILRELKTNVTRSFYDIVQLEKDIENINNILKVMQDRSQELNERIRIGKSRESEILVVESQVATLLAQQQKTQGDREESLEALSSIIGIDPSGIKLTDDTPVVTEAGQLDTYISAVEQRSDIEVARQDVAIQSLRAKISKGALLPTLDLDGSWYISRSASSGDWDAYLNMELPLFQGGILRSKIKEELSREQELKSSVSLLTRNATAEVKMLYKALVSSLKQASAYKIALDKAEKSYQLQLKDYKFGLVNNLDVIQAMTTMSDAKRNLDRALIQVKIDKAMLEIAVRQ